MQTFLQKVINIIFFSVFFFNFSCLYSQFTFYRDIFKGGICVTGTATWNSAGYVNLPYFIEPSSILKKIFLVTYSNSHSNINGEASDFNVIVNGQSFPQNFLNNSLFFASTNLGPTGQIRGHWTHISDITNQLNLSGNQLSIDWQVQSNAPIGCPSCVYGAPLLIILYDNPNLEPINVEILINEQTNDNQMNLNPLGLNPANFNKDIAMGIHSDRLGGDINDGYTFYINSTNVGNIYTHDIPSIGSGVIGTYYYQGGILNSLTDDTADDIIGGSDGLLKINNYCNSTLNNLNIEVDYMQNTAIQHNNLIGLYLAYSTPCDTFTVSVTPDTTICKGQNLQLSASGGQQYLWQSSSTSALGELSCIDCPNPIFSGDSSRLFTVQIWNNDSCSVVRPIKVNVREKPKFSSINIVPTLCGLETGNLQAVALNTSVLPISYAIDNNAYDFSSTFTSNVYSALDSGFYTIHLKDGNGCVSDSTVFVEVNNPTMASFTANPQTGAAPLFVSLENTAVSATDYTWFLNDVQQNSSFSSFVADTSGIYEIELIAWQNDVSCADTFSIFVSVYDSLLLQIPNIFTPNADGINDIFGITSNIPLAVKYEIYNRWGEVITYGTKEWSPSIIEEFYELWDASTGSPTQNSKVLAVDGVYFYKMEISAFDKNLNPKILDLFPIKKEGFFHLEK